MKTGSTLRGGAQLVVDTVEGVTDIVEAMYRNIAATPLPLGEAPSGAASGIAGLVYESIRRTNRAVGDIMDWALEPLSPHIDRVSPPGPHREAALAALNGLCGDHLDRTGNPLAISMRLRVFLPPRFETTRRAVEIHPEPTALTDPGFSPGGRLLLLVHGLCMSDREWAAQRHDHAQMLADAYGYTPVYVLYNSGRHISTNGRALCDQIAGLLDVWPVPVESITFIGFSMGGLVTRSALHLARDEQQPWLAKVDKAVYVGAPHQGAVMERGGYWLQKTATFSPYTAPLSALGRIRSDGITDLRHGNVLDDDWQHHDPHHDNADHRRPAPLVEGIEHYAVAATLSKQSGQRIGRLLGDGLVHPSSATGRHRDCERSLAFPEGHTRVLYGLGHLAMLHDAAVAEQLSRWLEREPVPPWR